MRKNSPVIPRSLEEWRHCIEVECGIALTPQYIAQRRQALARSDSEEVQQFRRLYGDRHWRAVRGWFEQAAAWAD